MVLHKTSIFKLLAYLLCMNSLVDSNNLNNFNTDLAYLMFKTTISSSSLSSSILGHVAPIDDDSRGGGSAAEGLPSLSQFLLLKCNE